MTCIVGPVTIWGKVLNNADFRVMQMISTIAFCRLYCFFCGIGSYPLIVNFGNYFSRNIEIWENFAIFRYFDFSREKIVFQISTYVVAPSTIQHR